MLDVNQSCGQTSKEQLDAEFGEGNCAFIACDVSNEDALKGNARDAPTTLWLAHVQAKEGSCFEKKTDGHVMI